MHDFLRNIGQVIVALWQLGRRRRWAPRAWNFYALWVSRLARLALIVVIGQPIAVILVSLAGVHELTAFVALTPIAALFFLLVVASLPQHQDELGAALAIGTVASASERLAKILGAVIKGLASFLLLDLAFGLYFTLLPIEADRRLVLLMVIVGLIFCLAVAVQKPERRKTIINALVGVLLVGSAIAIFVVFPIILLNGGRDETRRDIARAFEDNAKAAPVPTGVEGRVVARVTLPTDGSRSLPIDTNDRERFPRGECLWFHSEEYGTGVYQDGAGPTSFEELGGPKRAVYEFSNSDGGEVTALVGDC